MSRDPAYSRVEDDPGVPEAMGRALEALLEAVGGRRIETLWLFPPLRKGRREHGLLCAGCALTAAEEGEESPSDHPEPRSDRLLLVTLAYRSEETGKAVEFQSRYAEEGEAPPDRLPVVIEGVVRRADAGSGEPRSVRIEGDPERIDALLEEFGRDHHTSRGDSEP